MTYNKVHGRSRTRDVALTPFNTVRHFHVYILTFLPCYLTIVPAISPQGIIKLNEISASNVSSYFLKTFLVMFFSIQDLEICFPYFFGLLPEKHGKSGERKKERGLSEDEQEKEGEEGGWVSEGLKEEEEE